ncbi:tetratricopeptide repeat protein [Actinacidiphila acididurans]|uniref:Tetratricopeptide repeat protein n=1 Tax=Actinacidiphila acididurans TaxID=2784346 RepID=A0ABS2TNP4_9ACTN|nr:tetratricopeptide repeat protein [Actinacidiphila acididurans]MBM9504631.1 tetratricopeptide repeat protein [Actinacidiphila acididurans]
MKLFRPRATNRAGQTANSPLDTPLNLLRAGRFAEAEAEARAVAASRHWVHNDAYAPVALELAAMAVEAQGRHTEAAAEYDALLPVFGRAFGAEHLRTLELRSNRAQTLAGLGRHAEGEAEFAAVARAASRGTGPRTARLVAAARNGLVFALNGQGRYSEAEALAGESLAAYREDDQFSLVLRVNLARSLSGQGRHEEALAEAERADTLWHSLPEADRRLQTGAVELALATALLGLGRTTEARARATTAHDACVATFGPDHRRTVEARELPARVDGA